MNAHELKQKQVRLTKLDAEISEALETRKKGRAVYFQNLKARRAQA